MDSSLRQQYNHYSYNFGEWSGLNLHPRIIDAINDLGFARPTEIQRRVIPPVIGSKKVSVIGAAETVWYLFFIHFEMINFIVCLFFTHFSGIW